MVMPGQLNQARSVTHDQYVTLLMKVYKAMEKDYDHKEAQVRVRELRVCVRELRVCVRVRTCRGSRRRDWRECVCRR